MADSTPDPESQEVGEELSSEQGSPSWVEEPPPERLTNRELLERLVSLQEQQTASLAAIRRHTGCVYAWLILTVLLGILAFLANLRCTGRLGLRPSAGELMSVGRPN